MPALPGGFSLFQSVAKRHECSYINDIAWPKPKEPNRKRVNTHANLSTTQPASPMRLISLFLLPRAEMTDDAHLEAFPESPPAINPVDDLVAFC
jgi:hypothetical protein